MIVDLNNEDLDLEINELDAKVKEIKQLINDSKGNEIEENNLLLIKEKIEKCILDINDIKVDLTMTYDENDEKKNFIKSLENELKNINDNVIKNLKIKEKFEYEKENCYLNIKKLKNNDDQKNEIRIERLSFGFIKKYFFLIIVLIFILYLKWKII
jgi:hypothetical protein